VRLQICQVSPDEAEKIQNTGVVADCHFHKHLSRGDADQAVADGRVRFINRRAVVAVGQAPLSGYWYDVAVKRENGRYLGGAQSGLVRTLQLVNFMPRGIKR
jgi:hypothetical protein